MAMSRRELFGAFAAIAATSALDVKPVESAPVRRYGQMSVERHRQLMEQGTHLHVWHRGQDITKRCTFADDTREGMAELYVYRSDGTICYDYGEPTKEIVYGVTFKEGAPL